MYNQDSRDALYEVIAYEDYLIKELLEIQGLSFSMISDAHYTINDEGDTTIEMSFSDSLGSRDNTANFISKLAPLVLASAFKILDQILEWILIENGQRPNNGRWSFLTKYKKFTTVVLVYPDFLSSSEQLQNVIKGMFTYIWPRRNMLVHSSWGQLNDQNLEFDFEYDDTTKTPSQLTRVNETLSFNDIVAFADFSQQLMELLVNKSSQTTDRIKVLKILADKTQHFHGAEAFGETPGVVYKVHRITKQNSISLQEIRDILNKGALGRRIYFNLKITNENTNQSWELFSEDMLGLNELKLEDL